MTFRSHYTTGGMQGRMTAEAAVDYSSRLAGSMVSVTLQQAGYSYIRPEVSVLVLSGAKAAYGGDSCLETGVTMFFALQGNNYIGNGGLNAGGGEGGGGTQL